MSPADLEEIMESRELRLEVGKTLPGFEMIYLPHYLGLPMAEFHPEMLRLLSDWSVTRLSIAGFRGSTKSTNAGLALPIFAALNGLSKFIIPINETADVSAVTMANIRQELEYNPLIVQDFGHLITSTGVQKKKTETNLVLANGVRVMGISRGQKIRGLRHYQYRPDLIIGDDIEERRKLKSKDYRDETEAWIRGDVLQGMDKKGRFILINNMLHSDSIVARLKKDPSFTNREYPLLDANGKCTWPALYPTPEAIEKVKRDAGHTAWLREYQLKVVAPEGQIIKEEDIHYYDAIEGSVTRTVVGGDLAISMKATADYTALVPGVATILKLDDQSEGRPRIHVLPPTHGRMDLHGLSNTVKALSASLAGIYSVPMFYLEDVQYQKAAILELQRLSLNVTGIKAGADKAARLSTVAMFIKNGTVVFPRTGCEELLAELLGFGVEEHDDLVDALVYMILAITSTGIGMPKFTVLA